MKRLKTIIPVAGILLLILSAASLYVAVQALLEIRPAEDYEDIGVLTFQPYDVLPVQVQNTGASNRDRRMNPTKTVYMVYYRATDGSGYKWSDEALTRDLGKDIVDTYSFTEEQYRRSKETYYAWGLRILPEFFGLDPAEVVKGLEYDRVDVNGIPWGVTVRVDRTVFQDQGTFAEFVSQLVPYTMIGRYQIMCGVPAGEWTVHVTVKDAGSGEIILEQDFCG